MTEKIRVDSLSLGATFFSIWVMFSDSHPKKDLQLMTTSHWKTFKTIENLRGKPDYYHSLTITLKVRSIGPCLTHKEFGGKT